MDIGTQLVLAVLIACAIGMPIYFFMCRKYKKEGKSIKYLDLQIFFIVGFPIVLIPVMLSGELSFFDKVIIIILATGVVCAQSIIVRRSRKALRKFTGLPPEDEHTGEVMKKKKVDEKTNHGKE